MIGDTHPDSRYIVRQLHPTVFRGMLGLALLLVASAWGFFVQGGYGGLTLAVVTGLVALVAVLAWLLRRMGDHGDGARVPRGGGRFHTWLSRDFDTWQYRLKASEAVINILLPIVAVSLGLTLMAVVFQSIAP